MDKGAVPRELEEKIKQVEKDNSCDCTERNVPMDIVAQDVDMINPDANTLDRG